MVISIRFFATYGKKSTPKCADFWDRIFASYNEMMHVFVRYGENFAMQIPRATELTLSVFVAYKKSDRFIEKPNHYM